MWLILCEPHDRSALWAYTELATSSASPVEIVTPEQLVYSPRSVHRLGDGETSLEVDLADGRRITSADVTGVLNRMTVLPTEHVAAAAPADRGYAVEEMSALVLSWLACLRNVVNPPHPLGMAGHDRHPTEWDALAHAAGFEGRSSQHHVWRLVFDGEVFGPEADDAVSESCVRLADLAETRLLGVAVDGSAETPRFASATPTPDLRIGGRPFLDSLATLWTAA